MPLALEQPADRQRLRPADRPRDGLVALIGRDDLRVDREGDGPLAVPRRGGEEAVAGERAGKAEHGAATRPVAEDAEAGRVRAGAGRGGGARDEVELPLLEPAAEEVAAEVGAEEADDVARRRDDAARSPGERRVD